jgi:hypothetical protein
MKRFEENCGSSATPCIPLCPSQKKSLAGSADPALPNSRVTTPVLDRTDKPRHFSVKNSVPSSRKAMSQGLWSPDMRTD